MEKNKKIIRKFSLIHEGERENFFIKFLKNKLYDISEFSLCRRHSQNIKGTMSEKYIRKENRCCKQIYLFDKDRIEKNKIECFIKHIEDYNGIAIISYPSIEIYFLNFFEFNSNWQNLTTKEIIKNINDITKKRYKKEYSKNNLDDLLNLIEKEWVENKKMEENFESNLKKYNLKNMNNLFDFIHYLKSNKTSLK